MSTFSITPNLQKSDMPLQCNSVGGVKKGVAPTFTSQLMTSRGSIIVPSSIAVLKL